MSNGPRGRYIAALLVVVLAGGCATQPAPAAPPSVSVIAPPRPATGQGVPALAGEPVLTFTGRIGSTNAARALEFDAASLDRFGVLKVGVYEPWVKKDMEFQGVWLADVLAGARADPGARTLHFTALDDYQIDLSTAEVTRGDIFLATKRGDGTPIPIEEGGPTRIVFTGVGAADVSADLWIWSLKTIDVR
jgi:hypothetical protein